MKWLMSALAASAILAAPCLAGWKDDVGYTALKARLAADAPTGSGIVVTHTEASSGDNYLPDTENAEFTGKTIFAMSGTSGVSSHATTVGKYYYGLTTSISPGINLVFAYNANHWIGHGFLRTSTSSAPLSEPARAQNHSWIGTTNDDAGDADALRRIDLVIERDGEVVVAGVNNGAGSAMPKLLCSAYNVLAVGVTSGNSSYGPTVIETPGRVKPDLVAPSNLTSFGTPMVASAAAMMSEAVDADPDLTQLSETDKALLIKALLMGGATKDEFADWRRGLNEPTVDGSVPLDYRYGAGELNVDNSHRLLTGGRQGAGETRDVATTGWDLVTVSASAPRRYFFEIPTFSYARALSMLVTWNRRISITTSSPLTLESSLADVNLRLYEADGFSAGELQDQSVSAVDNVEHIFLRGVPSGRYLFELETDQDWECVITWDVTLAPTPAHDLDGDGDVDPDDLSLLAACTTGALIPYDPQNLPTGCSLTPTPEGLLPADFDQDHDIDQNDFGMGQAALSGSDTLLSENNQR